MTHLDPEVLKRCVKPKENSVLIKIEVKAGCKSQEIVKVDEWRDCLEVKVKARAEKGAANMELVDFLSHVLSVSSSDIVITRGITSPRKEIAISGLSVAELLERLQKSPEKHGVERSAGRGPTRKHP